MDNNIKIYDSDIEEVREICNSITSEATRNKAVANALGVKIAEKVFADENIEIDSESGLYAVPCVSVQFDIADLYIKGTYVDVRVIFDESELGVPKSHYDKNLLPAAYMFIKLSEDFADAEILGYIVPDNVNTDNDVNGYYPIEEENLVSFYDIEGRLNSPLDVDNLDDIKIYEYLENSLDNDKNLLKELIKSKKSRIKFKKIVYAQKELQNAVIPDESELNNEEGDLNISFESQRMQDTVMVTGAETLEEPQQEIIDDILSKEEEQNTQEAENSGEEVTEEVFEELISNEDEDDSSIYSTEVTESGASIIASVNEEEKNSEEIQTLFKNTENTAEGIVHNKKSNSGVGRFFLFLIAVLALGGYWWYTNNGDSIIPKPKEDNSYSETVTEEPEQEQSETSEAIAMPVETVEHVEKAQKTDEGSSISIPAIEQNLDASVLVSNLKVDWEVPAGYATNTAVKRYLVKVGKVIQLNLKTELLLLNKPPISSTVAVAIRFDNTKKKFEVIEITRSSGEKSVDDAILQTINTALAMSLSINTDSFGKLQGNPSIIIHF